jgi:general stress protein 26
MRDRFWEIVDGIRFPLFSTTGSDGFPHARPMRLLLREGRELWFATSRSSGKVKQITANPRVTVMFVDTYRFNYAYLYGSAHVVADVEQKRSLWQDDWSDDWPNGPSDPDYVLLKVVAEHGSCYHGSTGDAEDVPLVDQ